jgi:hypothetical protein
MRSAVAASRDAARELVKPLLKGKPNKFGWLQAQLPQPISSNVRNRNTKAQELLLGLPAQALARRFLPILRRGGLQKAMKSIVRVRRIYELRAVFCSIPIRIIDPHVSSAIPSQID